MKNFFIQDLKIHTLELTYDITGYEYKSYKKYFYSGKARVQEKYNVTRYLGFLDKGLRIELYEYSEPYICQLKYIINPSRFYDNNNYLALADIDSITNTLNQIGEFLIKNYENFPLPMECRITRLDLTKNIYVGDNIKYTIKLLNRCYIPDNFRKYQINGIYPSGNATFTKYKKNSRAKIFELSFYDKYGEMASHMKNSCYCYDEDTLEKARGILRMELRLYSSRLTNMKRSRHFHTAYELLSNLSDIVYEITYKNFRSLFMIGRFYKLKEIKRRIAESGYQEKSKNMMLKFIDSLSIYKNAELAAVAFKEEYGAKKLRTVLSKFNELDIIPVPIAVKKKISEWDFIS